MNGPIGSIIEGIAGLVIVKKGVDTIVGSEVSDTAPAETVSESETSDGREE